MPKTIEAIFEGGVLKPTSPLDIPEHKKLMLIIEDEAEEAFDIITLVSMVYNGLSPKDIEDVENVAIDRSHFSRDRN